eukprot:jgi/Ulvmu1/12390/UM009_0036.1
MLRSVCHARTTKLRCNNVKIYSRRGESTVHATPDKAASWPAVPDSTAQSGTSEAESPDPVVQSAPAEASPPADTPSATSTAPAPPAAEKPVPDSQPDACPAVTSVLAFYEAFNRGELDTMADRFSEDAVYHDAIYLEPLFGRDAIAAYFKKFQEGSSSVTGLKFVIVEITGSGNQCGVLWHTELDGELFPFSRGCSFYTVDAEGKIAWGRDCVEASPPKPGDATIALLGVLTPVLRGIGLSRADPANLTTLPIQAATWWAFYAGYMWWMLFSTDAPGVSLLNTPPETITELVHESLNFFYVNIALASANLTPIPSIAEHPVSEAVFNFVNAWGMMFLPVILTEARSQKVSRKTLQWTGIMFLTNIFFIPFLAQRAAPDPHPSGLPPAQRTTASLSPTAAAEAYPPTDAAAPRGTRADTAPAPTWHRAVGALGIVIGAVSLVWWAAARPEYGDVAARVAYFQDAMSSQRAFYAFVVDAGLYGFWQAWMMDSAGAPRTYCAVPFFGLGAWLVAGRPTDD